MVKGWPDSGQHMASHVLVGDDAHLGARPQRGDPRAERSDNATPDHDVVAAGAERDINNSGINNIGIGANGCRPCAVLSLRRCGNVQEGGDRRDDFRNDRLMRHFPRLHGEIGLRVDRLARREQLAERLGRIGGLQHWPLVLALHYPPHQHVEFGGKPDRDALRLDCRACSRVHERAAAGRQDLRATLDQARDHARLAAAEVGLAVAGENVRNTHAGGLLDLRIGVHEGIPRRAASRRPIDDLPTPIMPTSTMERRSRAAQHRGRRNSRIGAIL